MASSPRMIHPLIVLLVGLILATVAVPAVSVGLSAVISSGDHHAPELSFPLVMVIPFTMLLLAIALAPFAPHNLLHWWEHNFNRLLVAIALAVPVLGFMYWNFDSHDATAAVAHSLEEYISFVALLFTLYTISGGIHLQGNLQGTPFVNTTFLLIGTILASVIGTTGASMVLIRPLLATNSERRHVTHIYVFFIFLVSNIGGSLTPLGDPPLFLGFLRGVPFFWTMKLLGAWAMASGILLTLFYIFDSRAYAKETKADLDHDVEDFVPLKLLGLEHIALLALAIGVILATPVLEHSLSSPFGHAKLWWVRDALLIGLALVSLKTGDPSIRYQKNGFNFHAMGEVAALFLGIFICMIPALAILKTKGSEGSIPVSKPAHFMWATGVCSGFLDNAPTYLVYVSVAQGVLDKQNKDQLATNGEKLAVTYRGKTEVHPFEPQHLGLPEVYLLAISIGAVFFGALSYIGNAPNFMVNAICVAAGVEMPDFVSYIWKWALPILVPVYALVSYVFFVLLA